MTILLLLLSIGFIVLLTVQYKVHPFLALLFAGIGFGLLSGMPVQTLLESINQGFGGILGGVGLLIIFGIIIGTFLEQTGAAFRLAEIILKVIGEKRVHAAMGIIGYIVSIPVFADSGFVIMNPLNKSLAKKAGLSLAGTGVALMLGLMLTHTMVPPTPGPIAAAEYLGADIGLVMLTGLIVSSITLVLAIFYSKYYVSKTYIDPNPDFSVEEIEVKTRQAPNALRSFLPILVPIILIVAKSILKFYLGKDAQGQAIEPTDFIGQFVFFIGEPLIALIIGMFLSFLLPKKFDRHMLSISGWVGQALVASASIILITGAGGVFGMILRKSGMAEDLGTQLANINIGIWLPFIMAAVIKTAQGSSTVALVTTASILAPLMGTLGFETELQKALVVVAIGAGSAVVSHANDSGFWVLTQLINMDVKTGYKLYSTGTFLVGTFAAFLVFLAYVFLT